MALPVPKPAALLADKGYDGDRFRENLLLNNILPVIPPRSNRRAPEHPDYRRYRDRNRVERMFGFLKHQRRIATRFEKTALSYLSFPQHRRRKAMAEAFCQHDLGTPRPLN